MMDTKKVMEFAAFLDKKPEETKPADETKATETQAKAEETKEEPKGEETTTAVVEPAKEPEPVIPSMVLFNGALPVGPSGAYIAGRK